MDRAQQDLLEEHLKYELDMFDATYLLMFSGELKKGFIANTVIESFWTHARNLNEFFTIAAGQGRACRAASTAGWQGRWDGPTTAPTAMRRWRRRRNGRRHVRGSRERGQLGRRPRVPER